MTYIVDIPRSRRRCFRWPRFPLGEGQAAWATRVLILLTPPLSSIPAECLNYSNSWTDPISLQTALNLAWYYLGELFFYFVLRWQALTVKWAMGIVWDLGMANHYLISSRGRTPFPSDLLTFRTAANVAGNYDYRPNSMQWPTIGVFVVVLLVLSFLPNEKKRPLPRWLFVPVVRAVAAHLDVFLGIGFAESRGTEPPMWMTRGNGLSLNFSVCLKYMRVEQPETHSEEALAALAGSAPSDPAAVSAAGEDGMIRPVSAIIIMNESLSNPSVLPGVEDNTDAMSFLRSLTENTIKGYVYSSVFGGITANSEYESLTGNTIVFLPMGTMPYQMYVSDGDSTLVGQTVALGYRTAAVHLYRSFGWSRPSVYRDFGSDEVHFEGDFQDWEYMRGDEKIGYVTDRCDYENLIR